MKLNLNKADCLIVFLYRKSGLFYKDLYQLKLLDNITIIDHDGFILEAYRKPEYVQLLERPNFITVSSIDTAIPEGEITEETLKSFFGGGIGKLKFFIGKFKEEYGNVPITSFATYAYESINSLAPALKYCKKEKGNATNYDCIALYLKTHEYSGILGKMNYDKNGSRIGGKDIGVGRYINNTWKIINIY